MEFSAKIQNAATTPRGARDIELRAGDLLEAASGVPFHVRTDIIHALRRIPAGSSVVQLELALEDFWNAL